MLLIHQMMCYIIKELCVAELSIPLNNLPLRVANLVALGNYIRRDGNGQVPELIKNTYLYIQWNQTYSAVRMDFGFFRGLRGMSSEIDLAESGINR